ncbi:hypothetical protein P7K49_023512 [Saguinus oedipus]|uniref:Uncharacterized protein n=1 Tax=Saguinus oedipus TaxID=9490 RepID=A0ABQ9UMI1_SAGOE|nr:hypothetical protein P7K49_023512 [Saguinus oedipus]
MRFMCFISLESGEIRESELGAHTDLPLAGSRPAALQSPPPCRARLTPPLYRPAGPPEGFGSPEPGEPTVGLGENRPSLSSAKRTGSIQQQEEKQGPRQEAEVPPPGPLGPSIPPEALLQEFQLLLKGAVMQRLSMDSEPCMRVSVGLIAWNLAPVQPPAGRTM